MTNEAAGGKTITRAEVAAKIAALQAGTLDAAGLAAWAFNRFYAEELGNEHYEAAAEAALADALDALMFCNDPGFELDAAALDRLNEQLQ